MILSSLKTYFVFWKEAFIASAGCYALPLGIWILNFQYGPLAQLLDKADFHLGAAFDSMLNLVNPAALGTYCALVVLLTVGCSRASGVSRYWGLWLLRGLSSLAVLALLYFFAKFSIILWPWSPLTNWAWWI